MRTEKLYYNDAYIKDFTATLLQITPVDDGFDLILDKTAFFPEEGGQSSDTGKISEAKVTRVFEQNGVIHHICDRPLSVGISYNCSLDFDDRFDKMQNHTAEHIVCGLLHSLYSVENTGFHLGSEITFDTSIPVDREMLDRVEALANKAIFDNAPVKCIFPSAEEAEMIEYRSKMEISEGLRLVVIEGYDVCACCAPHVRSAGEIGFIKLLDFEKHKAGTRVRMLAGKRAYEYIHSLYASACDVSVRLCYPVQDIAIGVERLSVAKSELEYKLSSKNKQIASLACCSLENTEGSKVVYIPDMDMDSLRHFANIAACKVGGALVCLTGEENDYKYILVANCADIRELLGRANAALNGKGGGRGNMAQGSFKATIADIRSFFEE